MNATPDYLDPARRAAVRNLLRQTVDESVAAAPSVRRRRVVRFVSIATAAVLVVGGAGVAFATLRPASSPGGTAVAPPATSEPAAPATSAAPVAPSPTASLPAGVDPAGSASPVPTPTPTVDLADPSSWTITTAGVGPLTLGGDPAAADASMSTAFSVQDPGFTCSVRFYRPTSAATPFMDRRDTGGRVDYIGIGDMTSAGATSAERAGSPTTPKGIGVGSTQAELLAAYPGIRTLSESHGTPATLFGTTYGISDLQGRWLTFELDEAGQVGQIDVGLTQGIGGEFC